VRRDDELRVALDQVEQEREQPELVLRGQGRLGLVQEIQPAGHEPAPEQIEKCLPVGARVRVPPVAALHVAQRRSRRAGREPLRVAGAVAVLVIEVEQPLLELLALDGEAALEAEEVLGAQEKASVGALRPGEPQRRRQQTLSSERAVSRYLGRSDGRKARRCGDPLEQRGLPRPVLPHEAGHAGRQIERRQGLDGRDGEGKRRVAGGGRALQADTQEVGHRLLMARHRWRVNAEA